MTNSKKVQAESALINELPISLISLEGALQVMEQRIIAREDAGYIGITNTESMYHAYRIPAHANYIKKADLSLCDGVGVIAVGYFWGVRIGRVNGPALQVAASEFGQSRGWRHFFYGGAEGVAEKMAESLKTQFPDIVICGTYCPPFRALTLEEDEEIVKAINATKPDIVWVGLGLLKQERWIAEHLCRVEAPWMVGVGASFDYLAGTVPWAPIIIRHLGLEWLFRLIVQPKLRARRYWWSLVFVIEGIIGGIARIFRCKQVIQKSENASSARKEK